MDNLELGTREDGTPEVPRARARTQEDGRAGGPEGGEGALDLPDDARAIARHPRNRWRLQDNDGL